ncbi:Similar to Tdpoz5: TD and POZ domain-containing protein 5 (Mus musculus) [Cotesia congregata]|uniref:Similar to Tdpoz5: TD and POZ domain-containing protein 5 (Mus musculus) n=1 Tax=Cotesia congregata TaxID=51543 RepID=A0A8J2E0H4_COTCN|nr:Similar to Tdpoz5: TD and POZ domain-containing protein 5 (Mus musculus) [Cotesia congregata]
MEKLKVTQDYSVVEKQKLIYQWKIVDFIPLIRLYSYSKESNTLQSNFRDHVEDSHDHRIRYLKLNFNSRESANKEWISISLSPNIKYYVDTKYSVYILDNLHKKQFIQIFDKVLVKKPEEFCIPKFVEISKLLEMKDKFIPNNHLTIGVKVTGFIRTNSKRIENQLKTSRNQLVRELKDIFESKAGSDVVLLVGDKKIKILAHKLILTSRSQVFAAEFSHQLKIKGGNEITIPDMDPEVCEKLLEYIYTENITGIDEFAERLYEEAVKHQLLALKELCEDSLCRGVTVENAVKYLVLLDRHHADKKFFDNVLRFIALNSKTVIKTPEFKELEKINPGLLTTIVTMIASVK